MANYMQKVVITKIGADWCEPCKSMKPELEKLKKAHPNWKIENIDIDKHPEKDAGRAIPLTKICVGKKCEEIVGGITKKEIEDIVKLM